MPTADERIATLEAKLKDARAAKRRADARARTAQAKKDRRADTRRKILAGAVIIERANADPAARERLFALLDDALTRPDDRALFDLAPLAADDDPDGPDNA